jgi:uncharacterized membrane protein
VLFSILRTSPRQGAITPAAVRAQARDASIDILRGFAVFTMVAANMAAYSLREPHPWLLRLYGSLAAPTFIFLSGMMAAQSKASLWVGVRQATLRGAVLWAWAAALDTGVWGIQPFSSFDVLYVIGLALPVAQLCRGLALPAHAAISLLVVVLTPWLQHHFGYRLSIAEGDDESSLAWQRFFVDGWFPVFPWLGLAQAGALFGRLRKNGSRLVRPQALLPAALLLGAGSAGYWWLMPPSFPTRAGYSELFYPPGISMMAAALGVVLALLAVLPSAQRRLPLGWLAVYGRSSLLVYVVHSTLIAFVFKTLFDEQPLPYFLALYLGHAALLWLIARAIETRRGAELLSPAAPSPTRSAPAIRPPHRRSSPYATTPSLRDSASDANSTRF